MLREKSSALPCLPFILFAIDGVCIRPIPKKGDGSDPSNYRPIAITSLLSKVMESIINSQLWFI